MNLPNRPTNPSSNSVPTGAIIAISVIAATAFAVYESPEVRQFLLNLRRQAAHTLHNLGDNIEPRERCEEESGQQPLFNRPEDAEGVVERDGVDADDASRKRQIEELTYWNRLREEEEKEQNQPAEGQRKRTRSSSFGDFLAQDGDQGTYVLRSGAEPVAAENLLHRHAGRGIDRGAMFANPFGDEHGIELSSREAGWGSQIDQPQTLMTPEKDEVMSVADSEGLYCASDNVIRRPAGITGASALFATPVAFQAGERPTGIVETPSLFSAPSPSMDRELLIDTSESDESAPVVSERAVHDEAEETQYATSASRMHQDGETDAYAAIHAWADGANSTVGFYSPLSVTPQVISEASDGGFGSDAASSNGAATPKTSDSVSMIGGESGSEGRNTLGSWTEVGSVVSSIEGRVI
ncbi:hypothetical protein VC83_01480 [Pseudogymnoascus destructans]|uniref:Uncharacterized protein n=1 Tax=Pseudogymnoascus destructans TaxID=655981 RepID=A0A177AKK4_9PEZI|nr:uncharacterized protein VC83_01480 [Pseudogymnoascus destructans]OAF61821.2 hypothetical protein VC83_01480 [Pseudogymnoascus destructans]